MFEPVTTRMKSYRRSSSRLLSTGTVVLALMLAASPSGAVDCDDWNTKKFFLAASVAEVRGCLATGADFMARDGEGFTPLHFAALLADGHMIVEALLEAGADLMARDDTVYRLTPLHMAAMHATDPALVSTLLEAGVDIEAQDMDGRTPLHLAAAHADDPAVVMTLLKAGANPDAHDINGKSVWDAAQKNDALRNTEAYERLRTLAGK